MTLVLWKWLVGPCWEQITVSPDPSVGAEGALCLCCERVTVPAGKGLLLPDTLQGSPDLKKSESPSTLRCHYLRASWLILCTYLPFSSYMLSDYVGSSDGSPPSGLLG